MDSPRSQQDRRRAISASSGREKRRPAWLEHLLSADNRRRADLGQDGKTLRSSRRRALQDSGRIPFSLRRFPGLSVDGNGINHAIWGEGTSYDGPGGSW